MSRAMCTGARRCRGMVLRRQLCWHIPHPSPTRPSQSRRPANTPSWLPCRLARGRPSPPLPGAGRAGAPAACQRAGRAPRRRTAAAHARRPPPARRSRARARPRRPAAAAAARAPAQAPGAARAPSTPRAWWPGSPAATIQFFIPPWRAKCVAMLLRGASYTTLQGRSEKCVMARAGALGAGGTEPEPASRRTAPGAARTPDPQRQACPERRSWRRARAGGGHHAARATRGARAAAEAWLPGPCWRAPGAACCRPA